MWIVQSLQTLSIIDQNHAESKRVSEIVNLSDGAPIKGLNGIKGGGDRQLHSIITVTA